MEYRTLDEITRVATIAAGQPSQMIRRARLNRLAQLIEAYSGPIQLLMAIEYLPSSGRRAVRADYSPLSLAYNDFKFREEGLSGDTLGDAMTFFNLTDRQAHRLFCNCHYAYPAQTTAIAKRVRAMANRRTMRERWQSITSVLGRR